MTRTFKKSAASEKKFLKAHKYLAANNFIDIDAPDFIFQSEHFDLLIDLKTEFHPMVRFSWELFNYRCAPAGILLEKDKISTYQNLAMSQTSYAQFKANKKCMSFPGTHKSLYDKGCDLVIHTFSDNPSKLLIIKIRDLNFILEMTREILISHQWESTTLYRRTFITKPERGTQAYQTVCGVVSIEDSLKQFDKNVFLIETSELKNWLTAEVNAMQEAYLSYDSSKEVEYEKKEKLNEAA